MRNEATSHHLHYFGKSNCPDTQCSKCVTGQAKNTCNEIGGILKHCAVLHSEILSSRKCNLNSSRHGNCFIGKLKGVHLIHLDGNKPAKKFYSVKNEYRLTAHAFHSFICAMCLQWMSMAASMYKPHTSCTVLH